MSGTSYEPLVGARFLRMKLIQNVWIAANYGTHVYQQIAPSGVGNKYILMTPVSAEDLMVIGGIRVWTNMLWQVEAWQNTADDAAVAMAAHAIDTTLHLASGEMSGSDYADGVIVTTYRERALTLPPEVDGNAIWRRAGGEYRQVVRAS